MAIQADVYEVVGFRTYSFTDEKTGELKEGVSVFCNFEDKGSNITGRCADKVSIGRQFLGDWFPEVGQIIEPIFNRKGKVVGVDVLQDVK